MVPVGCPVAVASLPGAAGRAPGRPPARPNPGENSGPTGVRGRPVAGPGVERSAPACPPWAHGRAPGPRFHSRIARAHAGGGRPPRHSPKGRRSLRPTKVDPGVKGGGPSPSIGTTGVLGGRGATPGGRRRRAEPPSRTPKSGGSPAHARGCGGARWRAREWQGARRRAPPDPLGCPRAELSLPECAPGRQRRRGSPALSPLTRTCGVLFSDPASIMKDPASRAPETWED